jgi:amidase
MSHSTESFDELTIERFHAALRQGKTSSTELTRWYMDRIAAHNSGGAALQAIVTVNPNALAEAAAADAHLAEEGTLSGPLHGVPVLIKDQAETAGIRTTFGSKLFDSYVPSKDAAVVARLREAGAVILAKTSMCDFAAGWFSSSSMTEHTKNVYDVERDSGGSSAGTAAGISANFGLIGVGEDTGGSIRIPSSFNNLYGLRVTTGLISRTGFSPLVHFQDTPGPIARTVDDLARLLDIMVGYDPDDEYTFRAFTAPDAGHYAEALNDPYDWSALRIGVLETGFGANDDPRSGPVNGVVREALEHVQDLGAHIVPGLKIEDLSTWITDTSVYVKQSKHDIDKFLSRRDAPASGFMDVYNRGAFHPLNDLFHNIAAGPDNPDDDPDYHRLRLNQEHFHRLLLNLFAANRLDFILYPTVQVIPPRRDELETGLYTALTFPTNTVIGSQAGLPALSMPAGFTPDGIPVGMEVLGTPLTEKKMLRFASAWEKATDHRKAPHIA